jgi:hypothetical protein
MNDHFKSCPLCSQVWTSREKFLKDRDVELVGYQVDFEEVALGLFLFNHNTCKTTLAIQARQLKDLYIGPVFKERRTGQVECPGYCLRRSELETCPAECECAWVRGLLQIIRNWPKPDRARRLENDGFPGTIDDDSFREADPAC